MGAIQIAFVIRFEALSGWAQESAKVPKGAYLKTYSLDAHDGRGDAEWTTEPRSALKFSTREEAFEAWRAPSRVKPLRDDGKPNRPLTTFSVMIERL